jgi:ABC-type Zn uptake system ZnuABC Zn-binding protein ZnuA
LENRWPAMNPDALTATGGVRVFCVTDRIPPERLRHPSGPAGPPDPHVWMHPGLAELMVTAVEEALKTVMPKLADYFTPRAYKLRLRLGDIMTTTTAQLRTLKPEARALFTSHDTMQYFAAAFGMEARALTAADGQLPETLSADLSAWIKAHSVQVLFRDATSDMLALRRLLQEARVNPDNIIHSLTLAPAGSTALVSLKSYDVSLAVEALACTADLIQFTLNVH